MLDFRAGVGPESLRAMKQREQHWRSRIEWIVRALAQPKDVQASLFPSFVCLADELALEFEECLSGLRAARAPLDAGVEQALNDLDRQLEMMSGPSHPEFWTDEALETAAEWGRVRELAHAVLTKAAWPCTSPGPTEQVYVGPPFDT